MVRNTRVKRALSRKQVGLTPVSNTGIKPHTGDLHQFNTSIDPKYSTRVIDIMSIYNLLVT